MESPTSSIVCAWMPMTHWVLCRTRFNPTLAWVNPAMPPTGTPKIDPGMNCSGAVSLTGRASQMVIMTANGVSPIVMESANSTATVWSGAGRDHSNQRCHGMTGDRSASPGSTPVP